MAYSKLFGNARLAIYVWLFILAATVLGLSASLSNSLLPNYDHDFLIFALIVPSLTIFVLLLLHQWSQPRLELPITFIVGVLWLAMGAWSVDMIGNIQCYPLAGQTIPSKNGTMSFRDYCYQMKVIEAFSWMAFVTLALYFLHILKLTTRAHSMGRYMVWSEDIRELPWYTHNPGYQPFYNNGYTPGPGGSPSGTYNPYAQQMQLQQLQQQYPGSQIVQHQPGHSIVIQQNRGGGQPVITQVPGTISSV